MHRPRAALAACASLFVTTVAPAQNRATDALPIPAPPSEVKPFDPSAAPAGVKDQPAKSTGFDLIRQATAVFNQAKDADPSQFLNARDLFGLAFREKVKMTPDQTAAWAYCRIKVAADKLNRTTDTTAAVEVVSEVEDALSTVPNQLHLQEAASGILTAARKRAGTTRPAKTLATLQVTEPGWEQFDTANFRVRYKSAKRTADDLAQKAEAVRAEIFKRWSGPPGGDWSPKCEIVIHPTASEFAFATKLPATATGRAEIKMTDGSAGTRRIDLRADDATVIETALPRELTHVILADLFPNQPPPKWAELGMAVLNTSEAEVNRYLETVSRCARDGELLPVDKVMSATDVPAKSVTGFHVESVALVNLLVQWKGEKAFTAFIRDMQRYGADAALKRQYGLANAQALESTWKRGQVPPATR